MSEADNSIDESSATTGWWEGTMFNREAAEAAGHYVYMLIDGEEAFYIGKGSGNRAFQHAQDELELADDETPMTAKLQRIREIRRRGDRVGVLLLRCGIATSNDAYRLESLAIDLLTVGTRGMKFDLHNLVAGHRARSEGIMWADEFAAMYDAPPIEIDGTPVLLFRIPKLWNRAMSEQELYEATRGWWQVNPRRAAQAKYVLAVSNGIVREVYTPDPQSWRTRDHHRVHAAGAKRPRYAFDGVRALDAPAQWRNASVAAYLPRGFQGPFRYINC